MVQYIPKSVVVAEIGKRLYEYSSLKLYDACTEARASELGKLLVILNTLEVKEVDLDEEVERFAKECGYKSAATIDFQFAKHFFELSLKAQKGE